MTPPAPFTDPNASADYRTVENLRVAVVGLRDELRSLRHEVHAMAERLKPVEEEVEADRKARQKREERARLVSELREAGLDIPPGFEDAPATGVHPTPRLGWLSAVTDAAATEGGKRIIIGAVTSILAITAPSVLEIGVRLWAGIPPTAIEAQTEPPDVLPNQGPALPRFEGLQDDSPIEPRPSL